MEIHECSMLSGGGLEGNEPSVAPGVTDVMMLESVGSPEADRWI
jgi:hypothetical protein